MRDPEWQHGLPDMDTLGSSPMLEVLTAQGTIHGRGRLFGMTDRPTVHLERVDGSRFSWIADLGWRVVPEPKVGDEWTPRLDLALPDGSIMEWPAGEPVIDLALKIDTDWYTNGRKFNPGAAGTPWRIVRIGGAS